jgi:RNA polymerase sigma-70 factor (ECF subfamily)
MSTIASHARIQELMRHEGFLRKTLRGLLASEGDVQDVLQQTWLRALERRLEDPERPRTWLARVARNVALSGLRSQGRRARREREAAMIRAEESTPAESVARMEMLQRVVAAMLELDEPYRAVVLLRYEQDLEVRAIARKLGRSEATVRSQLSRAHGLLRARLDREFGARERWAALAAPLLVEPALGVLPVATGIGVTLVAGWMGIAWLRARSEPEPRGSALAAASPAASAEPGATALVPPASREVLSERTPAAPPSPAPSSAARATTDERRLPPAELLDRKHFDDYERATFSFEHGLRDDPELAITHNDWDVLFQNGGFDVRTVTNDSGLLADLGAVEAPALDGIQLAGLELGERARVEEGHSYFLWTLDDDTDLACLVFVREHERGKRCLLDWYATDGTGRAQGSLSDDGTGERLVDLLVRLRREALERQGVLRTPAVLLQARKGAEGGNESEVCMNGELERIDELAPGPLDLSGQIDVHEPSRAYLEGGWIPDGLVFHVTRVAYDGRALGNGNGRGSFSVVVGGQELVTHGTSPELVSGVWTGDIALAAGDERGTYLAIADSSAGEARLGGYFTPSTRPGFGRANAGFFRTVAPAPVEPAPGELLAAPRVVLQARAGAGGGNPNRIDLTGKTSIYVDRVEPRPLDFSQAPSMLEQSLVHFEGGHVPAGQAFVVTRATWWGTSAGDTNGHGELKLVVAGQVLVAEKNGEAPHFGSWTGRLVILPGEESRTYLEVANSSAGDVLLTGHFEPPNR